MQLTVTQAVLVLTGYALAAIRLLTASKPIWGSSAPARWATVILPALLVGLGTIPAALEGATTWIDVSVALVTAIGAGFAAARGPAGPTDPPAGAGKGDDGIPPGPLTDDTPPNEDGSSAKMASWVLLVGGLLGCSAPQPAPPCDPATLLAMNAECDAAAYQCGVAGTPEAECTAMADCDRRFDERAERCRQ